MDDSGKKPSFSETFPLAAVAIGAFRKAFGTEVKVIYVCENGREVGRKSDESRYHVIHGKDICIQLKKEGE